MPAVSVIIPAYHSGGTIRECLEALAAQSFGDFEVVLVDSTPEGSSVASVARDFPFVNHYHHDQRLLPHAARNLGVQRASGRILVFTDPDCTAASDWLQLLWSAHQGGHPVVGGGVGCLPGWWNLGVHLTKYGWWLPAGAAGPRPEIPTANASFFREVFEQAGGFAGDRFCGDSELGWRLRKSGFSIWFEPRAVVTHRHEAGFRDFIQERFRRGGDFATGRVEWLGYLLLFPLLPFVMAARACRFAVAGRYLASWIATSPVQLAGYTAWCLGEAALHWKRLWRR